MNSHNIIKKALAILILIGSVALIACSDKVYSANSSAGQESGIKQKSKDATNSEQSIPPPYNEKHRAKLQEKYSDKE
jgi:hypothetical protein